MYNFNEDKKQAQPRGDNKETIRQILNRGEVGHNGIKMECWPSKR